MAGITNKEFAELNADGRNYLTWASDVRIVLGAKRLRAAIVLGTSSTIVPTEDENDQALHFLRHHLSPTLKDEYTAMASAKVVWDAL